MPSGRTVLQNSGIGARSFPLPKFGRQPGPLCRAALMANGSAQNPFLMRAPRSREPHDWCCWGAGEVGSRSHKSVGLLHWTRQGRSRPAREKSCRKADVRALPSRGERALPPRLHNRARHRFRPCPREVNGTKSGGTPSTPAPCKSSSTSLHYLH